MDKFLEFWRNNYQSIITTFIILVLAVVTILLILFVFNRLSNKQEIKRNKKTIKLISYVIRYTIFIIAIITILAIWNVDVYPIVFISGIIFLVIGLAANSLIKDLIAGIALAFSNNYDVDEVVEIKGFKGRVSGISLRLTKVVNWKGEVCTFRNGEIVDIINFSKNPSIGIVDIPVAYEEDINHLYKLIEEGLQAIPELYSQIIEGPNIQGVVDLNNIVTIRVTVKTHSEEHQVVERAIRKQLKEVFESNNIQIPFNKNIVYHEQSSN